MQNQSISSKICLENSCKISCFSLIVFWQRKISKNFCKGGRFFGESVGVQESQPLIDLFTDTAAIFNLLDLRRIVGCPAGTRSVFMPTFRAKRELHCIFLGKKAIIITSKHGTMISFSHYNLFLRKLKEKLA